MSRDETIVEWPLQYCYVSGRSATSIALRSKARGITLWFPLDVPLVWILSRGRPERSDSPPIVAYNHTLGKGASPRAVRLPRWLLLKLQAEVRRLEAQKQKERDARALAG